MKTKIAKTLALLLVAGLMLSLAACGGGATKETAAPAAASSNGGNTANTPTDGPKRIVVQSLSDPGSFTLFDAGSSVRTLVQTYFYETLFSNRYADRLTPVLATGYEQVDDGVYQVTIRSGVYDTAGNPVTTDDVVWCFQKVVEGGMKNSTFGNVKKIEKIDDNTVQFTFQDEFVGDFRNVVCENGCPIVSRTAFEASVDSFASNPIGTGPYKIKSWIQGSSLIFEKNENYWDKELIESMPYDEVEMRFISESTQISLALETGEVDLALGVSAQDVPKFTEDKGFHQYSIIDSLTRCILFNCDETNPFSDVRLRQAVAYAIDAEAVITAVTNGIGKPCKAMIAASDNSVYPDYNMEWNNQSYYDYNPEKAKELLAEAGYPNGLKIKLMTKDTPEFRTTCEIMQAYLMEVGIEVEILAYENALYQTYRYDPTAFDMYLAQMGGSNSVVQPWKWYCTPNTKNNNKTIYMMDGTEYWPIYCEAAKEATHSPETVEAAWRWMKENVPMYGYGYTNKYVIYNDNIVDPFITSDTANFLPWVVGSVQ